MSGSVEDDLQEVKQRLQDCKQAVPAVDDLREFLRLVCAACCLIALPSI